MLSAKTKLLINFIIGTITLLIMDFVFHVNKIGLIIFTILFSIKSLYDYYQDTKDD